jgi:acyl carrier protein
MTTTRPTTEEQSMSEELTVHPDDRATAGTVPGGPELTATEAALADIWRGLFGIDAVTADDDFFEIGGNSLSAIKLLARTEEAFGTEVLEPETLYEDARLGSLARAIDEALARG